MTWTLILMLWLNIGIELLEKTQLAMIWSFSNTTLIKDLKA